MIGRPPKHPAVRQRRNKVSTAAKIELQGLKKGTLPPGEWSPFAREMWEAIWKSPLSGEYAQEDYYALVIAFHGLEAFLKEPSVQGSVAVLRALSPFGLTPFDRRRLNWTIKAPEPAKRERAVTSSRPMADPRDALDEIH
jgi:hypothetical protein